MDRQYSRWVSAQTGDGRQEFRRSMRAERLFRPIGRSPAPGAFNALNDFVMRFSTQRAAAIATAATILFALSATTGSGAIAQDQTVRAPIQNLAEETPAAADEIRFTATEVVQPLPDQTAADQTLAESAPQPAVATTSARSLRALVDTMPADAVLSRDLNCLATAIYFEARGETLDGQLAVGEVIINRAESGRFPQDYCGVVTQAGQFSFVTGGAMPQASRTSAAWQRASAIARIAHEELWDSKAGNALFFHASRVKPSWANRRTALARIDSHIFYR